MTTSAEWLTAYDELAKVAGAGRDVLEARIRTLVARAKELESENAYLRSTTPGVAGAGANGPAGLISVGETRPDVAVLAAALGPVGPSHA